MHSFKKKITCFLAVLILLQFAFAPPLPAAPAIKLELNARAAVLIDAGHGTVLYEKEAHKPLPPASLTKLMVMLLAMEDLESGRVDWDTAVTVSERAWKTGVTESQMFLDVGQRVVFKDLLKGIAIVSANDACIAVAEHLSGSVEAFVQRMNRRAAELGLENSHFANVHGLDDPDHYMTAADIAHLASYLIRKYPEAAAFFSEKEFTFNEIRQFNFNTLLGQYPGVDGIKTGSTPGAGYCLASTSEQKGMRLIGVVLHANSNKERQDDSIALLDYGFCNFEIKTLYRKGEIIAAVPVKRGQKKEVGLVAAGPVQVVAPRNDSSYKITEELELPRSLEAPVEKGDFVGTLHLKNGKGEPIADIKLETAESLKKLGFFPYLLRQVGSFFSGLWHRIRP